MATGTEENVNANNETRAAGHESGGLRNSLPLVLSGIAVLIAALALIANQMGQPAPRIDPFEAMNNKLGQIEARIGDMESQLTSDKLDGVSMQLKRILLELEQLSMMADETTRSKIEQARQLLQPLSEPATSVKAEVDAQSTLAPENQTAPDEPAVTDEPAASDAAPVTEPEAPAVSAPDEPAAPQTGSDQTPAEGDMSTPEPSQPIPESPTPATPQEPVTHQ
ncbi:MAG: hypothetical protein COS82_00635 [Zetaproteobacteria bacterium CG06_land_8_20_14_3_00_59_53]|nr:MAG: hypothetical protein AUK36_05380 [Zetaproteobacteria bacterium CG2_30_59_37]PIO90490.1 MAG: hypothetical protein COX56_01690 [Zetaproteobacteria bacterium CG23_combo_of_CG06-09_8_20_14_all_59_86]PIQ65961.1 MAG: hypothetical protein COV97_01250 [Zetaproteobacteria bacterium CG11_big_fil_rev_8_21_14_0_20_59_439]PIU71441.1 MAG: hypothetical protein COS82_00635 [Zetaproteobacteria bacterium CG06_land_8_20_14_3_00_59_53]PIU97697.1 MAG: hypothetical protein COS62_01615 [Zetaproteobacteria bac